MDKPVKSPDAFRTISEVSDILDVPQHVLRFWEGKFSHIKPMKRGGNRRYYRPEDLELLRAITHLLYTDGYTIKGVQKLLRENGVRATVNSHIAEHGAFQDDRSPEEMAASVADAAELAAQNDAADDQLLEADSDDAGDAGPAEEPEEITIGPAIGAAGVAAVSLAVDIGEDEDTPPLPPLPDVSDVIAELQSIQAILKPQL